MLALHNCLVGQRPTPADLSHAELPSDIIWIDVLNGEEAELAYIEKVLGLKLPTQHDLSEIESSSRLRSENGAIYLSVPLLYRSENDPAYVTPVGFVLTRQHLITIRYQPLVSFTNFVDRIIKAEAVHHSSVGILTGLVDSITGRFADLLENVEAELDAVSRRIFGAEAEKLDSVHRPARQDADLRRILRQVGRCGDLASKLRDSLLAIGRIIPFVTSAGVDWLPAEVKPRLDSLRLDVISLNDYDAHLMNKVQLLLDATLGLINIEQNNIIKVLTIVSVVGVPPTLVASMYGMNFKNMPELDWSWGYPYGLALIFLSAVLPLLWFKLRGWL
jgi:magnesium transporter